jgi:PAS domain S-box-containing protein
MTPLQQHNHLELANESVMTRTVDGIINFWNRSAERLYGWRKEEAIGRVSHSLLQTQFPKPLEEIDSELLRTGRWHGKLVHTTRDGARVVVESDWILEPERETGPVVEINRCSAAEIERQECPDNTTVKGTTRPSLRETNPQADDWLLKISDFVLAGAAVVSIFACFYFIYYYGWSEERHFSHPFDMVVYWVFPAVLATVLFALLRWNPESKSKAAMVCVSIVAAVWLLELLLAVFTFRHLGPAATLWGPTDLKGGEKEEILALAKQASVDFDRRRKVEVVMDLRNQGIHAAPNIVPLDLLREQPDGRLKSALDLDGVEILPVGGISNRISVVCNETGQYAIHKTDEHGFHNPRGIWESAPVAIAAVGDSFVEGSCLASDKNFVAQIRRWYPATLNLGKSGNGPMITLAALQEYLPWKQPKRVLWFHFEGNEFEDLLEESKSALLKNYLQAGFSQQLIDRQKEIDEALTDHVEWALKKELAANRRTEQETRGTTQTAIDFLKLRRLRQTFEVAYAGLTRSSDDDHYSQQQLDLFRRVLIRAQESVQGWGGQLYFVYLPARDRYVDGQNYHRETVLGIVRDVGLPVIDVHARFQREKDPLRLFPFGRFGHYNEEGARLTADEVLRALDPRASR